LLSFQYAFKGLATVLRTEQNFRVHFLAAIVMLFLSVFFQIRVWQWVIIILMIMFVFIMEMLNTVFERLVDMLKPRIHLYVYDIKNIMSGMVLITAISAIIIGLLIFWPYFQTLFSR
jgi:diacylglycerol kinase